MGTGHVTLAVEGASLRAGIQLVTYEFIAVVESNVPVLGCSKPD